MGGRSAGSSVVRSEQAPRHAAVDTAAVLPLLLDAVLQEGVLASLHTSCTRFIKKQCPQLQSALWSRVLVRTCRARCMRLSTPFWHYIHHSGIACGTPRGEVKGLPRGEVRGDGRCCS